MISTLTLTRLQGQSGKKQMICSKACGVTLEGRERVVRVGGRPLRSRLRLLRLRAGNV